MTNKIYVNFAVGVVAASLLLPQSAVGQRISDAEMKKRSAEWSIQMDGARAACWREKAAEKAVNDRWPTSNPPTNQEYLAAQRAADACEGAYMQANPTPSQIKDRQEYEAKRKRQEIEADEKYKAEWLRKNSSAAPTPAAPVAKQSEQPVEVSEHEGRPISAGGASCASVSPGVYSRPVGTAGWFHRYDYEMTNRCGVPVTFTLSFKDGSTHNVHVAYVTDGPPTKWFCTFGEHAFGSKLCDGGITGWNYR